MTNQTPKERLEEAIKVCEECMGRPNAEELLAASKAYMEWAEGEIETLKSQLSNARYYPYRTIEPEDRCPECSGTGDKVYPSTALWRGGIGGQALTGSVCNKCWGSGNKNKPWMNWDEAIANREWRKKYDNQQKT